MFGQFESAEEVRRWRERRAWQRQRFAELAQQVVGDDGLTPTSELLIDSHGAWRLAKDPDVPVYPDWRVREVADYLLGQPRLWPDARIRVQPDESIAGRALVYGVPFGRAIETAMARQLTRSLYHLPRYSADSSYCPARLLVQLEPRLGRIQPHVVLQSWEWIGEGIEVDYAHMILDASSRFVTHLDGALIAFEADCDARSIFDTSRKRWGRTYNKYFRVDRQLERDEAVELVRRFFPVEELNNEYFECIPRWPAAITEPE